MATEIQDAATAVYSHMKSGHAEFVYQRALAVELQARGWLVYLEVPVVFTYADSRSGKSHTVGSGRIDIVATSPEAKTFLIEIKVSSSQSSRAAHKCQLMAYSRNWSAPHMGVLVVFKSPSDDPPSVTFVAPAAPLHPQKGYYSLNKPDRVCNPLVTDLDEPPKNEPQATGNGC